MVAKNPLQWSPDQIPAMLGSLGNKRTVRPAGDYPSAGLAMRFTVRVSGLNLGAWSSCRGLNVHFNAREVVEGGDYYNVDLLPERITFSAVTLERAVSNPHSAAVQQWLRSVADRWTRWQDPHLTDGAQLGSAGTSYQGETVVIRLHDHQGREVTQWVLERAYPKEWSGPELSADSHAVALERLTLAHCGFGFLEHP